MEMARQTRYGLLESKCAELDIPCLMTAHHAGRAYTTHPGLGFLWGTQVRLCRTQACALEA